MSDIDPCEDQLLYEDMETYMNQDLDLGDPPGEDGEEEEDGANTETMTALALGQASLQRDWVTAESCKNAQPPWLPELYDITRDDLNVMESTEKGGRAIWKLMFEFQSAQGITPGYHSQFGLCLYANASFTKVDGGDDSKYDEQKVLLFF